MTGKCPVPGCAEPVSRDHLMCRAHWHSVPRHLRDAVWRAYRAWQRGKADLSELREAQGAAIAAAQGLGRPGVLARTTTAGGRVMRRTERSDLDREPEIARADGRTVQGELKRLVVAGCVSPVEQDFPSGRIVRLRATSPTAVAVKAVIG